MKESIDTGLSAFFKDRLTNPVISSFAISWSLYNYKFFVILLSNNTVTEMSALIKERFPDIPAILLHGLILPGLFAALYLFGTPYVTAWYYGWLKERQKKVDDARYAIETSQRLTVEESRAYRATVRSKEAQIDELEDKLNKAREDLKDADKRYVQANNAMRDRESAVGELADVRRLLEASNATATALEAKLAHAQKVASDATSRLQAETVKFKRLQEVVANLQNANSLASTPNPEVEIPRLSKDQLDILVLLGNDPDKTAEQISDEVGGHRMECDYVIDQLEGLDLIKGSRVNGEIHYAVTPAGRKAWKANTPPFR